MQCETLIQMIQERRECLLETIELDKEHKLRILKVIIKLLGYSEHIILILLMII